VCFAISCCPTSSSFIVAFWYCKPAQPAKHRNTIATGSWGGISFPCVRVPQGTQVTQTQRLAGRPAVDPTPLEYRTLVRGVECEAGLRGAKGSRPDQGQQELGHNLHAMWVRRTADIIASTHTWQSKADAPAPPRQSQARAAPPLLVSCSLARAAPSRARGRSTRPAVTPIPPAVAATTNIALTAAVKSAGRATQTWYPSPRPDCGERTLPAASSFARLVADGAVQRRLRQQGKTSDAPHGGAGVANFSNRSRGRSPPRRMSTPSGPGRGAPLPSTRRNMTAVCHRCHHGLDWIEDTTASPARHQQPPPGTPAHTQPTQPEPSQRTSTLKARLHELDGQPADEHYSYNSRNHTIANLQKMAVAETREAEPTQHRKEIWLAVEQPRSNYWLEVTASNLASQSTCLARVTQSHCNPQWDFLRFFGRLLGTGEGTQRFATSSLFNPGAWFRWSAEVSRGLSVSCIQINPAHSFWTILRIIAHRLKDR